MEVMAMVKRSGEWYRTAAGAGVLLALLMVGAMEALQAASLPLWLHLPLTAIVLGLLTVGAGGAGVAYLEYQSRSANSGQQA
jgi:hypothetical protein